MPVKEGGRERGVTITGGKFWWVSLFRVKEKKGKISKLGVGGDSTDEGPLWSTERLNVMSSTNKTKHQISIKTMKIKWSSAIKLISNLFSASTMQFSVAVTEQSHQPCHQSLFETFQVGCCSEWKETTKKWPKIEWSEEEMLRQYYLIQLHSQHKALHVMDRRKDVIQYSIQKNNSIFWSQYFKEKWKFRKN